MSSMSNQTLGSESLFKGIDPLGTLLMGIRDVNSDRSTKWQSQKKKHKETICVLLEPLSPFRGPLPPLQPNPNMAQRNQVKGDVVANASTRRFNGICFASAKTNPLNRTGCRLLIHPPPLSF